ncbi:MAG: histidine phosphatase family protein [Flavobacterium sp.]|nr:histidine phosphatase family protein [Pedobacter sp.]
MKLLHLKSVLFIVLSITLLTCKEEQTVVDPKGITVTSEKFIDDLLFVDVNNYQINTSEPATFSSPDPFIQISSTGNIKRITSAEIVSIDIVSINNPENKTRIYALGVNDTNYDKSNVDFNGLAGTDAYNSYVKGWKTLQSLPNTNGTYALILRHADADKGRDIKGGPDEWWKSCDSTLARQLNEKGRRRSVELGKILKDLKYPISRVISSEFCRARETAELINAGPAIAIDGRLNHPDYNVSKTGTVFKGMLQVVNELPVDNTMTLIETHHPINELRDQVVPTFPNVIPFPWTGGYIVKIATDKTITFEGAVSFPMLKYFRDLKFKQL